MQEVEEKTRDVFEEPIFDPETNYERFKKKYSKKNDPILAAYLEMSQTSKQLYFPPSEINPQTLEILSAQPLFSARVIFVAQQFRDKPPHPIIQKVCNPTNETFKRYQKLKDQYQERYLADIGRLKKCEVGFKLRQEFSYQNYKFYSSKKIESLHDKRGDYDFLEDRHDYIQWMFPNHYASMFNSQSFPMSYVEVRLFRRSEDLGKKLLESIEIFFDFMGLKLHPNLQFELISEKRLRECLLVNSHNHLRLRRILACLSITGFRPIALKLIELLRHVIQNEHGYKRLQWVFEREWEVYGDKDKEKALKLCFHPQDQFPKPHAVFLNRFTDQQGLPILIKSQKKQMKYKIENFDSESPKSQGSFSSGREQKMEEQIQKSKSQMPPSQPMGP